MLRSPSMENAAWRFSLNNKVCNHKLGDKHRNGTSDGDRNKPLSQEAEHDAYHGGEYAGYKMIGCEEDGREGHSGKHGIGNVIQHRAYKPVRYPASYKYDR